ncbi:MAG: flagellar biosynthesis protein FlhF [Desulfurella sp.]|jgi:flagellar biosynthesis protein FlhF|uniref:flagellar biosynthesis protein FlhF n=1 Tax=Desulfurella TaxID=33001 RepID=UPI000CB107EA|nr:MULTISPECIES: flagellar biosynthesis protein FlhF [Desulfurella]PMP63130.1 MAG: flagellar biosynthesis protein FlhF [Desulfurella multipotens]PMP93078.1 MAG: flagellar biosynthesis protein FlhF [Desulfurella sp.]HEX12952.1 flagellar biosynthesis protein FlhF [Desulfurella acetivorans]
MIIKTFEANNLQEAIKKIKKELGEEAVILSTRKVRKGSFFSFFKREVIEVTAAIEHKQESKKANFASLIESQNIDSSKQDLEKKILELENLLKSATKNPLQEVVESIKNDLDNLKSSLSYMAKKEGEIDIYNLPISVQKYFNLMNEKGINKKYSFKISKAMYDNLYAEKLKDENYTIDYLTVLLSQFFKTAQLDEQIVVLTGPTGVGKTTTIAKLAAIEKLKNKKKVSIITTDTYRIGAVDQLLTYSKIMEIPMQVCITKNDLQKAVNEFSDYDKIFIDTVGRSQKDIKRLEESFNLFKDQEGMHFSLVLALNTKEEDCMEIYEKFSKLRIDSLLLTKLDETNTPGTMLNFAVKTKKPISYISFGQDVPDDIVKADPLSISSFIIKNTIKEEENERSS